MEMNPQKTEKSSNRYHPLWIGLGFGGAIYVIVVTSVTLLQFFLQFTLAAGSQNTSEFWIQGIVISFFVGSGIGIPLAIFVGFLAGCVAWLIKWLIKTNKKE